MFKASHGKTEEIGYFTEKMAYWTNDPKNTDDIQHVSTNKPMMFEMQDNILKIQTDIPNCNEVWMRELEPMPETISEDISHGGYNRFYR